MKVDVYSTLKATRHLDVIQAVRDRIPARPVHVQIIVSDLCNQSCSFCAHRDPSYSSSQLFFEVDASNLKKGLRRDVAHPERNYNPNRMIPYHKAIETLDDCKDMGVEGIQYTGGGEPTVHPKFAEILIATIRRELRFSVVSNGANIEPRGLTELIASAEWVRISLDAGTEGTYMRMRNVSVDHWRHALRAISGLRRVRDEKATRCVIGVGFVVTPDNWDEVLLATQLVKEHGADNIRISAQFSTQDEKLFTPFAAECANMCREAESLATPWFQVYNRFSAKLDDLKLKQPDYSLCGYQFLTTYIGADLNTYRCCVFAYSERGKLGSIRDRRFKDLWMSQARADEMAAFKANDCDRCQFNNINRGLEYMMRPDDPPHSEFV